MRQRQRACKGKVMMMSCAIMVRYTILAYSLLKRVAENKITPQQGYDRWLLELAALSQPSGVNAPRSSTAEACCSRKVHFKRCRQQLGCGPSCWLLERNFPESVLFSPKKWVRGWPDWRLQNPLIAYLTSERFLTKKAQKCLRYGLFKQDFCVIQTQRKKLCFLFIGRSDNVNLISPSTSKMES